METIRQHTQRRAHPSCTLGPGPTKLENNVPQLNVIFRYLAESEQIGVRQEQATEPAKNAANFKPRTLQREATINEFRHWQNRFRGYFTESKATDQVAYLHRAFQLTCINDNLADVLQTLTKGCLLYTSPSPRDRQKSRMPSSA